MKNRIGQGREEREADHEGGHGQRSLGKVVGTRGCARPDLVRPLGLTEAAAGLADLAATPGHLERWMPAAHGGNWRRERCVSFPLETRGPWKNPLWRKSQHGRYWSTATANCVICSLRNENTLFF